MKKYVALFFAFALIATTPCDAQRRRTARKPAKEVVQENPLVTQMLEAIQKVMFIDSMVVEKDNFYSYIPLSKESGQLLQKGGVGQYTNELGDHRIEALLHSGDTAAYLATSDLIAGQWTQPAPARGIGSDDSNFPYVMPDGTTLYFAQKGEKSIGGYDIFVTRYNAENASFLRPENIGMPFASEANDYLYVVDEPWQLGYFVTDRRQPEGMVCIYVFIPETSRRVYPSEAYSPEQLRSLAGIASIADTWDNEDERKNALERLRQARQAFASVGTETSERKETELDKMKAKAEEQKKALAGKRKVYASATAAERETMKQDILAQEKELENMLLLIRQKEKEERNRKYNNK